MSCKPSSIIDIQGHRGCRGLLPENSLPAFKKAIEMGVHTLEMDLVVSKDKKVVVSHEPFMNSVICLDVNKKEIPPEEEWDYNLYQMNYEEIKIFDCGSKFHPDYPEQQKQTVYKPLLKEVFELSESLSESIKFNIELKSKVAYDDIYAPAPEEFVRLVLEVIDAYGMQKRTNLQSFDVRTLEAINRQAPRMRIALLIDEDEEINSKLKTLSFKPDIISPEYKLLTGSIVKDLQSMDYEVIPWTVNEEEDLKKVITMGVNGIITDYPDVLMDILRE